MQPAVTPVPARFSSGSASSWAATSLAPPRGETSSTTVIGPNLDGGTFDARAGARRAERPPQGNGDGAQDREVRRRAWLLGLAMTAVAALAYGLTLPDYGLVSDEGNYRQSSARIVGWFVTFVDAVKAGEPSRAFTGPALAESWRWGGDRIPHPPLSREIAGVSELLFRRWLDPLTAYRLLGTVVAALLVGTICVWGSLRAGAVAGLVGAATFLSMPRVFAHAHFADTDFVVTALFFASLFCAAELRRWPLGWAGALAGLALATKFSALLIPCVVVPWVLLFRRDRARELPVFFTALLLSFAAVNPAVWADPLDYVREFLRQGFHRRGVEMAQLATFYLGRLYVYRPPWHYPLVFLLVTTPPGVLLLTAGGAASGLADRAMRPAAALVLTASAAFLAALELPSAPLHDDIRLFLPVFPCLALLAGFGCAALLGWCESRAQLRPSASRARGLRVAGLLIVGLTLAEPTAAVARMHPFQASYFNALVGGVAGAARRGLEVTIMKEALNREVYRDLNALLPRDVTLDGGPFLYEDLLHARELGWLRPDLVVRDRLPADYVLLVNRTGWLRASDLALLTYSSPAYAVHVEGVPLVALYRLE